MQASKMIDEVSSGRKYRGKAVTAWVTVKD